jgi:hypothetical protein
MKKQIIERLIEKCDVTDGCWTWKGAVNASGYGTITIDGKTQVASRMAYRYFVSDIYEGMNVCHHCDNPLCIRPSHLFLGTQQDNMIDRNSKGRAPNMSGSKHPRSKLTDEQVNEILTSPARQTDLAKKYGVSQATISLLISRRTWKHI